MLDSLQQDHATLAQILETRRAVTVETMSTGQRLLWRMYLSILEDALSTVGSLIQYLSPKKEREPHLPDPT